MILIVVLGSVFVSQASLPLIGIPKFNKAKPGFPKYQKSWPMYPLFRSTKNHGPAVTRPMYLLF